MTILGYDRHIQCALADAPEFPPELGEELNGGVDLIHLDEWCSYFIKFYGEIPVFIRQAPYRNLVSREFPGKSFEINFKNAVGLTRIGALRIQVCNRKIGDDAFYALLNFIGDRYAGLVSDWNTATGYAHRQDKAGRNIPYIEFLLLKKYLLSAEQSLESLVNAILADPHRRLCREIHYQSIEKVAIPKPALIIMGLSKPGNTVQLRADHPLLNTALGRTLTGNRPRNLYLQQIPEERKYHSYDTPENRLIKHILNDILQRLKSLQSVLGESSNYLHPSLDKELANLQRQVQGSLEDPFWREIGLMRFVPLSSPVLQRKEGYRQLFSLYSLLQLLTRYDLPCFDFSHLLECKNTAILFEYWCFFLIKEILDKQLGKPKYYSIVIDGPHQKTLIEGISLKYVNGLSFCFNRNYFGSCGMITVDKPMIEYEWGKSYSQAFCPDFSLHYQNRVLILDAKYKGDREEDFYGECKEGVIESWKDEDLIKMHAYRDAVLNAVGSFILYPGKKTTFYPTFDATYYYQGVGAIALYPEKTKLGKEDYQTLQTLIYDFINDNF